MIYSYQLQCCFEHEWLSTVWHRSRDSTCWQYNVQMSCHSLCTQLLQDTWHMAWHVISWPNPQQTLWQDWHDMSHRADFWHWSRAVTYLRHVLAQTTDNNSHVTIVKTDRWQTTDNGSVTLMMTTLRHWHSIRRPLTLCTFSTADPTPPTLYPPLPTPHPVHSDGWVLRTLATPLVQRGKQDSDWCTEGRWLGK